MLKFQVTRLPTSVGIPISHIFSERSQFYATVSLPNLYKTHGFLSPALEVTPVYE